MEATASEFGYSSTAAPPSSTNGAGAGDHFIVEDLLDFSNDDGDVIDGTFDHITGAGNSNSGDTPVDSCNSSFSGNNNDLNLPLGGDICAPYQYEDLAELEWLSNFVEESFSSEDLQKLQLISGMSAMKTRPDNGSETRYYHQDPPRTNNAPSPVFSPEMSVPGKARSKRSRAAPGNWASRLLLLSPASSATDSPTPPALALGHEAPAKPAKSTPKKKSGAGAGAGAVSVPGSGSVSDPASGEVRKCLHCATDKTPQWRTGPLGPKTLCNACGVRYKSGRLVPEYRPAASPTFMLTKHSNSHRKVMELRRQKEMMKQQQFEHQQQHYHQHNPTLIHNPNSIGGSMMYDPPNGDDYLIHQHIGPDFRQLI